jgi:septum formation inhibitor MinC
MSQAPSAALAGSSEDRRTDGLAEGVADVTLRGTTRGLEIWIAGTPSAAAIGARLSELLAEAPGFFAGSQARVAIEGVLPVGALACLEEVAARFELRLVEIGQAGAKRMRGELTPLPSIASHGLPALPPLPPIPPIPLAPSASAEASSPMELPAAAAAAKAAAPDAGLMAALAAVLLAAGGREAEAEGADDIVIVEEEAPGPRLVIGPVRSGRIVDHVGHLIVIGDVNPGAEVRAEGSIIVLGRLRGVAHAAIGRDVGCIIALSLQPQQLRIGRMVARAGDADRPGGGAEIAYATGETIVVERFVGRLPSGLAASM